MKDVLGFSFFLLLIVFFSCGGAGNEISDETEEKYNTVLFLADRNATYETKALYSNLWEIQKNGFMFGHHLQTPC